MFETLFGPFQEVDYVETEKYIVALLDITSTPKTMEEIYGTLPKMQTGNSKKEDGSLSSLLHSS